MRYMELPRVDVEGKSVRIRPDRVDVVDEIEEEYNPQRDESGEVSLRAVTLVFVQGRRNPWRVTTPAAQVVEMLHRWSQTGRLEEDDDDDYRD